MQNMGVHIVVIIDDKILKAKEEVATDAFRQFFPDSPAVKLYRTSDGQIGLYVPFDITGISNGLITSPSHVVDAFQAVLKVINESPKPE